MRVYWPVGICLMCLRHEIHYRDGITRCGVVGEVHDTLVGRDDHFVGIGADRDGLLHLQGVGVDHAQGIAVLVGHHEHGAGAAGGRSADLGQDGIIGFHPVLTAGEKIEHHDAVNPVAPEALGDRAIRV